MASSGQTLLIGAAVIGGIAYVTGAFCKLLPQIPQLCYKGGGADVEQDWVGQYFNPDTLHRYPYPVGGRQHQVRQMRQGGGGGYGDGYDYDFESNLANLTIA